MHLAGTVAVPQTFPELGRLSLQPRNPDPTPGEPNIDRDLLVVEHRLSPKLTITRTFFLDDVAAVFIPGSISQVHLDDGTWLVAKDIGVNWRQLAPNSSAGLFGIAYVRESAATLMQVDVGMTAAESVEYYPPLSHDRSVDHYRFSQSAESTFLCDTVAPSHDIELAYLCCTSGPRIPPLPAP